MTDTNYEETLLASVVVEDDRQLALHEIKVPVPGGISPDSHTAIFRWGWQVGLFDADGNAVAILARIEPKTLVVKDGEVRAWALFLAMVPTVTVGQVRNQIYFDLGSGPERTKV